MSTPRYRALSTESRTWPCMEYEFFIGRLDLHGDVHNLTLTWIEFHIPLRFPFLQYIKVILELFAVSLPLNMDCVLQLAVIDFSFCNQI